MGHVSSVTNSVLKLVEMWAGSEILQLTVLFFGLKFIIWQSSDGRLVCLCLCADIQKQTRHLY